jgi:tRNA threonylcarbamoyladenosine biosynthesis protein TsaB
MLTLAIETSTPSASVALGDDTGLLAEARLSMRVSHSESVMPDLVRLFEREKLSRGDIDAVVVGAGPGSFTGVRVAAAIAKGLCFAGGIRLYAYGGLLTVAAGTGVPSRVCALLDARRDEVYAAAYSSTRPLREALEPSVLGIDRVLDRLAPVGDWTFAGDAALRSAERIEAGGGRVLPPEFAVPRAATLLRLVREYPELGRIAQAGEWEPSYLRASGAERAVST